MKFLRDSGLSDDHSFVIDGERLTEEYVLGQCAVTLLFKFPMCTFQNQIVCEISRAFFSDMYNHTHVKIFNRLHMTMHKLLWRTVALHV